MKELTIEEKAKRYDEAIERAKCIYIETAIPSATTKGICTYIFPELKESEDEKIRKELISFVRGILACHDKPNAERDEKYESWLAWIEKQGEPVEINPTEFDTRLQALIGKFNSLPKEELIGSLSFWLNVVQNDGTYKADEKKGEQKPADKVEQKFHKGDWVVYCGKTCKITGLHNGIFTITNQDGSYFFNKVESTTEPVWHLWTIKDAKDGDVLCDYHETYDNPLIFILKKFEHVNFGLVRPSDYSSYCFLTAGDIQKFKEGTYHHKHNIKPATKEQCDILFTKMKEAGYEWDAEKKELKKISQRMISAEAKEAMYAKTAWSEKDEEMRLTVLQDLQNIKDSYPNVNVEPEFNWLKTLKDRVQPKVELTQLDKNILEAAIAFVEQNNHFNCWGGVDKHTVLSALRSIRYQNRCKPSDE